MNSNTNQIEEIKNKLDIVQVIEKYVKLKQAGKNFQGLCPFHQEKTPSFIVSPDIQRYKCFGCGETGDIFNFIQKIDNLDFPEALEKLAAQAGVELTKKKINYKYKTLEDINYLATKYYFNELKNSNVATKYLEERGFSKESIKKFGVGYAPRYPKLREYLFKNGKYTQNELIDSGLFSLKEGKVKEKFYDRIMFPIRSTRGKVIAFTGRVLPGNDWGPKYMNSPDTPIFHKKENVFGQYESRQEIRKNDIAIFCEGSTDVISAHQHGIKNIVAPLGTGLTIEQLKSISLLTKNVLFFFDSDSAGINALVRGFKLASELNLNPYAYSPEPYKDIDEMLQREPKSLESILKNKTEAFSFILINYIKDKNLEKLESIVSIRNFIGHLLFSVNDTIARDHYIEKFEKTTKLSLKEEVRPHSKRSVPIAPSCFNHVNPVQERIIKRYVQLLLLSETISTDLLLPEHQLGESIYHSLFLSIVENYGKGRSGLYNSLSLDVINREIFENLLFDLSDMPTKQEDILKELKSISKKVQIQYYEKVLKTLNLKIAISEESNKSKESDGYLKEMSEINNILKKLTHD